MPQRLPSSPKCKLLKVLVALHVNKRRDAKDRTTSGALINACGGHIITSQARLTTSNPNQSCYLYAMRRSSLSYCIHQDVWQCRRDLLPRFTHSYINSRRPLDSTCGWNFINVGYRQSDARLITRSLYSVLRTSL